MHSTPTSSPRSSKTRRRVGTLAVAAAALAALCIGDSATASPQVTSGTSVNLAKYRNPYAFTARPGTKMHQIKGIAVGRTGSFHDNCASEAMSLALYRDGTFSAGASDDLDSWATGKVQFPPGKSAAMVVGVAMTYPWADRDFGTNGILVWYTDGTVSGGLYPYNMFGNGQCGRGHGGVLKLDDWRKPYAYTTAPGYQRGQIRAVAVDASSGLTFAYYSDGKVSAGTSNSLGKSRPPQAFTLQSGKSAAYLLGVGIDPKTHHVYGWTR